MFFQNQFSQLSCKANKWQKIVINILEVHGKVEILNLNRFIRHPDKEITIKL